jgi:hypothetical protein
MSNSIPALGIFIDLPLGLIMWAAIIRFAVTIFLKEDSKFALLRLTKGMTSSLLKLLAYITPSWIIDRIAPLYLAFWLFVIRYYLMPLIIGYDVYGFSGMPLEDLLIAVSAEVSLLVDSVIS